MNTLRGGKKKGYKMIKMTPLINEEPVVDDVSNFQWQSNCHSLKKLIRHIAENFELQNRSSSNRVKNSLEIEPHLVNSFTIGQ